jgi:hypothetical protein
MEYCDTPFTPLFAHGQAVQTMLVIPEEDLLLTATEDSINFFGLPRIRLRAFDNEFESIQALGYHAATKEVLVGSMRRGLFALNLREKSDRRIRLPYTNEKGAMTISPDGSKVAFFTNHRGGELWHWETKTLVGLKQCTHTRSFVFSHDGAYVAAYQGQEVGIWKTDTGDQWYTIPEEAAFMCFLPDHSLVIGTQWNDVICYQYGYGGRSWNQSWSMGMHSELREVTASPGSAIVACLIKDGIVSLDQATGRKNGEVSNAGSGEVYTLAVASKHNLAFAGDGYGLIWAWSF